MYHLRLFLLILTKFPFFQKRSGCNFKGTRPSRTRFIACSYIRPPLLVTSLPQDINTCNTSRSVSRSINWRTVESQFCFTKHKLYIVTILEWRVFILVIFANFTLIRASLRFIIRLHGRNVDRINAISCGNAEQVKLSTTKLRQNKEKNKNSEFWKDKNEYSLHLKGKPSSIYCFSID